MKALLNDVIVSSLTGSNSGAFWGDLAVVLDTSAMRKRKQLEKIYS